MENVLVFLFKRGPSGLPDPDRMDEDQPGTSSGRPDDQNGDAKPKTQAQIKSESLAQNIVNAVDGCAYNFRCVILSFYPVDCQQLSTCGLM